MPQNWKQIRDEILEARKRALTEEPEEAKRVRLGIIPSGQGNFGGYWGIVWYWQVYTMHMGEHVTYDLMRLAQERRIPLDMLKQVTQVFFGVGDWEPGEFMGALGYPSVYKYSTNIIGALDQIKTEDEFIDLMGAFHMYINTIRTKWNPFPQAIAYAAFRKKTPEEIRQLIKWLPELEKAK